MSDDSTPRDDIAEKLFDDMTSERGRQYRPDRCPKCGTAFGDHALGCEVEAEKQAKAEMRRLEEDEARGEIFPDPDLTDEYIDELARIDEENRPVVLKRPVGPMSLDEARRFVVRCPDLPRSR